MSADKEGKLLIREPASSVLFLDSTFVVGGAERITYNVIRRLDGERYRPVVCTLYGPGVVGEWFIRDGYRFYSRLIKSRYDPSAFWKLRRIVRQEHIELVFFINQPLTTFWGVVIRKCFRIPTVAVIHNTFLGGGSLKLRLNRCLMNRTDVVVAVAEQQREHLVKNEGIHEGLIRVIRNGMDLDHFKPRVNRPEQCRLLSLRSKDPVVGIVARLVRLKGVDIFLQAAKTVLKSFADTQFVIVGDGPESDDLKRVSQALGIASSVSFLGRRDDIAEVAGVFDIGVLCSRTEALPMVILEYMALSIPVIATQVGGVSELISDKETGLLIPVDDAAALARALEALLRDPARAKEMGQLGRARVERSFLISHTVQNTELLFDQLLLRSKPAGSAGPPERWEAAHSEK